MKDREVIRLRETVKELRREIKRLEGEKQWYRRHSAADRKENNRLTRCLKTAQSSVRALQNVRKFAERFDRLTKLTT